MTTVPSSGGTDLIPRRPTGSPQRRGRTAPLQITAVTAVVVLNVAVLGYNALHYPYLENDEGTYVSQGWAVFAQGRLSPYTYFYDHPPGGWLQIAGWQVLTGGADGLFGHGIASGRIFMLALHAGSTLLVVATGRRLTGSLGAGLLAALVFGLSPYGIEFHRRVLLDNIAAFWMLAAFLLLLSMPLRLSRVWLSAVALAVAVWSKEIAVTVLPALAVLTARRAAPHARWLSFWTWLTLCLSLISLYPLMALLRGELFPYGELLGGRRPHVSLLCGLQWQASRSTDGGIADFGSGFWQNAIHWASEDPVVVVGGTAAALACVVLVRRDPGLSMLGWLIFSFWLFLGRGGLTLGFYLVPLLPFLALALAAVTWRAARAAGDRVPRQKGPVTAVLRSVVALGCAGRSSSRSPGRGNGNGGTLNPQMGSRRPSTGSRRTSHRTTRSSLTCTCTPTSTTRTTPYSGLSPRPTTTGRPSWTPPSGRSSTTTGARSTTSSPHPSSCKTPRRWVSLSSARPWTTPDRSPASTRGCPSTSARSILG